MQNDILTNKNCDNCNKSFFYLFLPLPLLLEPLLFPPFWESKVLIIKTILKLADYKIWPQINKALYVALAENQLAI